MYSFEGQFKRKPIQALGGKSKVETKDDLLQRAQEERRKREAARVSEQSSIVIQAFFRGICTRKQKKNNERQSFDRQQHALGHKAEIEPAVLTKLCRQIIFFYENEHDCERLMWLCQLILKHQTLFLRSVFEKDSSEPYRLKRILRLCCRFLYHSASVGSVQIAIPLRMLETFTQSTFYEATSSKADAQNVIENIMHFLVLNDYYSSLRQVLNHRVPSRLEYTVTPPTPLSASLLTLVNSPLRLVENSTNTPFKNSVLQSLCTEFFSQPYTEQIREFLLPALAYGESRFPFFDLLNALQPIFQLPVGMVTEKAGDPTNSGSLLSPWLLHSLLTLAERRIGQLTMVEVRQYLLVLHRLVPTLQQIRTQYVDDDDEEDEMEWMEDTSPGSVQEISRQCLRLINDTQHVDGILHATTSATNDTAVLTAVCTLCHTLAVTYRVSVNSSRLMYSLAFNPTVLRNLWLACISVTTPTVTGGETALLQSLSRGLELAVSDRDRIVPLLSVFSSLFSYSMFSLHDSEFYGDTPNTGSRRNSLMPFRLDELVTMSHALRDACLGIVELAHPETRPEVSEQYQRALQSVGVPQRTAVGEQQLQLQQRTWSHLFKVLSQLVKLLYARDSRRKFCPLGHWLTQRANIHAEQLQYFYRNSHLFQERQFGSLGAFGSEGTGSIEGGPPMSTKEARQLTILQELPFVVAFSERIKIFNKLVQVDRTEAQGGEMRHFGGGNMINITVRRNYLYEDSFERLSLENEPNLKPRIHVQLKNFAGLNEAGIDGGGLFREFVWELLKTSFDPNRGLFKCTTDRLLYPNPHARLVLEDFRPHYFFLGRMLGKALYEGMLVELPFASFFLSKLLSRHRGDVDIDYLASLDPEMYRNLLFLKNYDGDVSELALDFCVTYNELGEIRTEELKPRGKSIPVTNRNRIEYIHLMADYMLNKRIREQCDAFRQGLANVINMEWLRMFNHNELQVLISGAAVPIDIDDLRRHTNYSGGYTAEHEIIVRFWDVVSEFSELQKRQLLRFVTSCSRPPLLGFKDLFPAFCIHNGGKDIDRLPSASTCMNLLKLPEFTSKEMMREKLLYAIEANAGFELS